MHATVTFHEKMPLVGTNRSGHKTLFDMSKEVSPTALAATPLDAVLQALGGCSMMDILSIIRKMRKEPISLTVDLEAERAEEHPKVFTAIHINYRLASPDATLADLEKAAGLSMEKYCSVAAMLRASGCKITWATELS